MLRIYDEKLEKGNQPVSLKDLPDNIGKELGIYLSSTTFNKILEILDINSIDRTYVCSSDYFLIKNYLSNIDFSNPIEAIKVDLRNKRKENLEKEGYITINKLKEEIYTKTFEKVSVEAVLNYLRYLDIPVLGNHYYGRFIKDSFKEKFDNFIHKFPSKAERTQVLRENSCLKKFGAINNSCTEEWKTKVKHTIQQHYGGDGNSFYFQLPEAKDKIKQINIKNYGVECLNNLEWKKEKAKQTNLERYGVEVPTKNEEVKRKGINTSLNKYGVSSPSQYSVFKEKSKKKKSFNIEEDKLKFSEEPMYTISEVASILDRKDYRTILQILWDNDLLTYFGNCGTYYVPESSFLTLKNLLDKSAGISIGEGEVANYLEEKNIRFERQKTFEGCKDKNLLKFDFYLPDYNCCVEYQGIQHYKPVERFGGEEAFKENQRRDLLKKEYCENNNIKLLTPSYKLKGTSLKEFLDKNIN